jgi:protein phosphatase
MLTHPGRVRMENEDTVAYLISEDGQELIAIVADGVGGRSAGEVASRMAADIVLRRYLAGSGPPPDRLAAGIAAANEEIYARAQNDPACAGMATTCTALAISGGAAFVAHVGDSRAYVWRYETLRQITEDHSLIAAMVREGRLTAAEAVLHPSRNILLRALGTRPECEPAVWPQGAPVVAGDRWVLCSDGLSDALDASTIAATVSQLPPRDACYTLIDKAFSAGAADNISVGVFGIGIAR